MPVAREDGVTDTPPRAGRNGLMVFASWMTCPFYPTTAKRKGSGLRLSLRRIAPRPQAITAACKGSNLANPLVTRLLKRRISGHVIPQRLTPHEIANVKQTLTRDHA